MLRFLRKKHTLPNLPYDYNALEPVISAEIMQLHHQKHHNAYVTNLNLAEEKLAKAVAEKDATSEIECQSMIKFNGGEFGSFENFKTMFSTKTAAIQGSGWGWLGFNKQFNRVEIATTENQDPLVLKGLVPLLGIDVWEHAYYLQYKNVRPDYLKNIWKIINWKDVSERLQRAK